MAAPEDLWESILFEATFGGVRIDVQSTRDQLDRAVVEPELVHVDGAELQDKGGKARRTEARIIFFPVGPGDDPMERLHRFIALKDAGPQDFVHPIFGTLRVRVPNCTASATADERDAVVLDVTFVEDSAVKRVRQPGAVAPRRRADGDLQRRGRARRLARRNQRPREDVAVVDDRARIPSRPRRRGSRPTRRRFASSASS
jgi:prophage DNA circulation protein